MNIITDKITFGGNSFSKINGKSLFIPYAIPGEVLDVEIVKEKSDWAEAKIVKIIESSPLRIIPPCKYYGICGGCNMMHIEAKAQKSFRLQMLQDVFLQNNIKIEDVKIIEDKDFNYRSRFQLNDGGLCKRESNETVQIDECLCAENCINQFLKEINEIKDHTPPLGRVHIFGSEKIIGDKKVIIENTCEKNVRTNESSRIIGKSKKTLKLKSNNYFSGTVQDDKNSITVELLSQKISFDARGFFQSNLFVFEKVISLILENLPEGEKILDIYSGCGSISLFLTQKFKKVVLVEHNRDALVYAEKNLLGKNHTSYGLSASTWVKNCSESEGFFDSCVVDPPRSGMEIEVLEYLCKSKIPLIAYLSCNPATQARDCKKLIEHGYKIKKAFLCDFYPNTSHIESLLFLER